MQLLDVYLNEITLKEFGENMSRGYILQISVSQLNKIYCIRGEKKAYIIGGLVTLTMFMFFSYHLIFAMLALTARLFMVSKATLWLGVFCAYCCCCITMIGNIKQSNM